VKLRRELALHKVAITIEWRSKRSKVAFFSGMLNDITVNSNVGSTNEGSDLKESDKVHLKGKGGFDEAGV